MRDTAQRDHEIERPSTAMCCCFWVEGVRLSRSLLCLGPGQAVYNAQLEIEIDEIEVCLQRLHLHA